MQKLTIQGIESKMTKTGNTKVTLVCAEGKFYFYRDTKTGTSKAHEQFVKFGFKMGDVVEAEVQSEDKTFTNGQGKEITYKDNWIKFFGEVEHIPLVESSQASNSAPQSVPSAKSDDISIYEELRAVNARIDKMGELFTEMRKWQALADKEILGLKTLSVDLNGKEATELHTGSTASEAPVAKKFDFGKAKEILQDPNNSIHTEEPEGFR